MLDLVVRRDEDARGLAVASGDKPRMIDGPFEARNRRQEGLLRPAPLPLGDRDDFDREAFPHFFIFTELQLGRRMSSPSEHSDNAKVIAPIPVDRLKTMTLQDFIDAGLQLC